MRASTIAAITFASAAAAAPAGVNWISWYWSELAAIESKYHITPEGWPTFPATTSSASSTPVSTTNAPAAVLTTSSTPTTASLPITALGGAAGSSATTIRSSVVIPTITSSFSSSIVVSSITTSDIVPTASAAVETPLTASATSTASFVSPVAPQAASLAAPSDYPSIALYGHNIHRQNHSAPALTYNTDLAGYAATVAVSCNFAHDLSEGGGGYGQNIAAYGSSDLTGFTDELMLEVAISDQWYDGEVNYFLPEYYGQATPDMDNFEAWGHFSQIVWYSSTSVGCATQLCAANTIFDGIESYFTVCNYLSAGNVGGLYGVNVLEPLGEATYAP